MYEGAESVPSYIIIVSALHIRKVKPHTFSKALPDATRTFRKLRRDVSGCTSGHNDYYVGTYQMLRRDVISSMSSVKLQKNK